MTEKERTPFTSVKEAQDYVKINFTNREETISISDTLNDNIGMNMAIIADGILNAGYMPMGFEQMKGFRIYKYKKDYHF